MLAASARAAASCDWPPTTTNSIEPSRGSASAGSASASPGGISRAEWAVTPSPATVAARKPARLPLVQATRQALPARSSVSMAWTRVMLGGG